MDLAAQPSACRDGADHVARQLLATKEGYLRNRWCDSLALGFVCFSLFTIIGCMSLSGGQRIDNIPMYGQPDIKRPEYLKKADADFIAQASALFGGDRSAASDAWIAEGDKHMKDRNLDYAMRRYNQAWLLNPDSYRPYWGFARVATAQQKFDEAFMYFQEATQLINDKYQEAALVCDFGIAYHNKANGIKDDPKEQGRYYELANQKFKESIGIDPSYPNSWGAWAFSLYYQGKYAEAWAKTKKAKSLDPNTVSKHFFNMLQEKMPEPN